MQLHPRAKKHRCYLWTGLMLPWCIILIGGGIYHNSSAQVYEHTKGGRNETAPLGFLSVLPYSCPMTQPSAWHSFHSFLTHLLHSEASGVLWQGHETRHSRAYWTPSWSSLEVWCPVVHCCLALHTSVGYQLHNLSELNAPGPVFSLFKFTFIKAMEYIPRIFMYFFFKKQENKKKPKKKQCTQSKTLHIQYTNKMGAIILLLLTDKFKTIYPKMQSTGNSLLWNEYIKEVVRFTEGWWEPEWSEGLEKATPKIHRQNNVVHQHTEKKGRGKKKESMLFLTFF